MSGGSWDYAYWRMEESGRRLIHENESVDRAQLGRLLLLVGKAMHDIEWVDSCDYGDGEDVKAIRAVLDLLKAPLPD